MAKARSAAISSGDSSRPPGWRSPVAENLSIFTVKATEWQAHSVRGFISGTLGKKMGLVVTSAKTEAGERVYSIQ